MTMPGYPADPETGHGRKPRRHKLRWFLAGAGAVIIALIAVGAAIGANGSKPGGKPAAVQTSVSSAPADAQSSTPAPAPVPSPAGNYSGSCDVQLNYPQQSYLTAQVTLNNTGNVGTVNRVRVSWPLQGFAPVTVKKTVRVKAGQSRTPEFHYPASQTIISEFQDAQLASSSSNVCSYHVTIINTYGNPQG